MVNLRELSTKKTLVSLGLGQFVSLLITYFHWIFLIRSFQKRNQDMVLQVGGWTEEYEGLTFVTVRGAGHEVPLHRPKLVLTIIKSFLSGTPMPPQSQQAGVSDS